MAASSLRASPSYSFGIMVVGEQIDRTIPADQILRHAPIEHGDARGACGKSQSFGILSGSESCQALRLLLLKRVCLHVPPFLQSTTLGGG
jgi:hypothetical protein